MEQPAKNSLSILGVGLALGSLWFTWMSCHQVPIESEAANVVQSLLGGSEPMTYTGVVNGCDGELLGIPIWVVAVLIISMAHVSQLMDASDFFFVPSFAKWGLLLVAVFFPVFAIVYPLFCPGVRPSYGPYIALLSAAIASVNLMSAHPTSPTQDNVLRQPAGIQG